jgi:hypothetical protein
MQISWLQGLEDEPSGTLCLPPEVSADYSDLFDEMYKPWIANFTLFVSHDWEATNAQPKHVLFSI